MVFVQALRLQRDGFSAEPANPVVARIHSSLNGSGKLSSECKLSK